MLYVHKIHNFASRFILSQTPASLADLIAKVAQRDQSAFAELYQASHLKLFGVILRILRQKEIAEEVLQEVYIKIWDRAADFRLLQGSAITWMVSIARNRALDEVRRFNKFTSLEEMPDLNEIADTQPLASTKIEQSQGYQKLQNCLEGLEPEKREILLLAYYNGSSREQLAKKFSQPLSTIKTWLRRSLLTLKLCLEMP